MNEVEVLDWIKNVLKNKKGRIDSNKIKSVKYQEMIKAIHNLIPLEISIQQKVWLLERGLYSIPLCSCGKQVLWQEGKHKFSTFCSPKCARNDTNVKNKQIQTNLKKYGVACSLSNSNVRSKIHETNIKKYGVPTPFEAKEIQSKVKKTMQSRYGVDNVGKLEKVIEARAKTNIERYGATSPLHGGQPAIRAKETMVERYGSEYAFQNPELFQKFQNTMEERYQGNPLIFKVSSPEKEIVELLRDWGVKDIQTSTRKVIKPYELDIYLPEYNIAIEFNGVYWHSELSGGKSRNYHLNKHRLCESKGINLIQIFSTEWEQKKQIVINMIKAKLGIGIQNLHARKMSILPVAKEEEKAFLNLNHIQGYLPSSEAWGLYDKEGKLYQIATFGQSRYNSKVTWELIRSATLSGYRVRGGLSKLLSLFKRQYPNESLISYCDKRLFEGTGYTKVGFIAKKDSTPNYFYTKDYKSLFSRVKYQKHRLSKLLENFDPELTEWENMSRNGFDRIWDAGMRVYILTPFADSNAPCSPQV